MVFLLVGVWETFLFMGLMDEITEGWNQISLQGLEDEKFDLRSKMGSKDFILAAKFHTKRS